MLLAGPFHCFDSILRWPSGTPGSPTSPQGSRSTHDLNPYLSLIECFLTWPCGLNMLSHLPHDISHNSIRSNFFYFYFVNKTKGPVRWDILSMETHISVNSSVCNHLYTHTHTHTHTHTYIYIKLDMSSYWCLHLQFIIPWIILASSLCSSEFLSFQQGHPGAHHLPSIFFAGLFQDICLVVSELLIHEKVEAVTDFTFLGSKITADTDCSHEIKRYLFFGREADKSR